VRATASGATAAVASGPGPRDAGETARRLAAARTTHAKPDEIVTAATGELHVYAVRRRKTLDACIVERGGVVRLVSRNATIRTSTAGGIEPVLRRLLYEATSFGDVGRALPDVHLVYAKRLADLGALAEEDQVIALALEELRGLEAATPVVLIASRREA